MKVLVIKNRISKSLKPKLNNVKKWFSPVIDLEFTEEETNFDIINGDYTYFDVNGKQQSFKAVEEDWYDQNISILARDRGFDIVIFIVEAKSWLSKIVEGFGTSTPDFFVEEIAIQYFKSGTYKFNDVKLKGDKLEWILIHEILHRLYNKKELLDNTHKYFLEATPEKCLEDFKQDIMKTWKYFKLTEKTGSLGHTVADLDINLVDKLDELRGICGFPFNINSGYRTTLENLQVGGVNGSAHTKRLAVDIACTDTSKRMTIVGNAWNNGFIGIGIADTYIHLDIDNSNKKRIWLY